MTSQIASEGKVYREREGGPPHPPILESEPGAPIHPWRSRFISH
jgi:hypothetical protein